MALPLRCSLVSLVLAVGCLGIAQDGVSTAGEARTRSLSSLGLIPSAREVVVEDFVNYHRHEIPRPKAGEAVALDLRWETSSIPKNGDAVLQVGLSTALVHDREHLRPLNLTLVIDKSGSMADDNKLVRVKESLSNLIAQLRPTDVLSIVGFDSDASVLLPSSALGNGDRARQVIRQLEPGTSTNLSGGLMLGYQEAMKGYEKGAVNRVILLTDGIANRGEVSPDKIAAASLSYNDRGIDLSTIGVGRDLNTDLLATLAKSGRGLFHFVADSQDIAKVFSNEVQSLLSPVASDPVLEIESGPGTQISKVYGYQQTVSGRSARIDLDTMNSGMTEVVLLKLRHVSPATSLPVKVRLSYFDLEQNKPVVLTGTTSIGVGKQGGREDESVAKNYTIATVAEAIHDMAADCEAQRFEEAQASLDDAITRARRRYPSMDDPDVSRVLHTALNYQSLIANRNREGEGFNHIRNGDFSEGSRGFTSDLGYFAPSENCLWPMGYTIAPSFDQPQLHRLISHQPFSAPERTTRSEQVLFANAGGTGSLTVWSAEVRCQPNTHYRISFESISLTPGADWIPTYEIRVNGFRGDPQASRDGIYQPITTDWTSGNETTARISIVRLPIPHGGGIIGIADIKMVEMP